MGHPQLARSAPAGQSWSIEDSLELYNVPAWGLGYFSINAAGHVVVGKLQNKLPIRCDIQPQERRLSAPTFLHAHLHLMDVNVPCLKSLWLEFRRPEEFGT